MFSDGNKILRTRIRTGFQVDINKRFLVLSYDELLLNLTGVSAMHFLDHNRTAFGAGYIFNAHFSGEAGYLRICRKPLAALNTVREKCLSTIEHTIVNIVV